MFKDVDKVSNQQSVKGLFTEGEKELLSGVILLIVIFRIFMLCLTPSAVNFGISCVAHQSHDPQVVQMFNATKGAHGNTKIHVHMVGLTSDDKQTVKNAKNMNV